ncbi:MAG: acyltransferase [Myxococcales bacterium]|jgi:surface polysaccharide O-acyltransferase-like enzyme
MESKRLIWADLLRALAVWGTVLIHSAAPLLERYRTAGPASWWIGNAYDSAVRWCVPLFVMLSGALLLGREQPFGRFLANRFRKAALPFLVWSVVYFFWARHFHGRSLEAGELPRLLLSGGVYYHLWFFSVILALYLLVPLLQLLLRKAGRRGAWVLVAGWALVASVLPVVSDLAGWSEAPESVETSPLRYLGYFVLGFLLRDLPLARPRLRLLGGLFLTGWALTAAGTWWLTVRHGDGAFDGLFYEYFAANVLLMSVAVFLLGRNARLPLAADGLGHRWLRTASASALGVYLVHAMVIDLLKSGQLGARIDETSLHPLLGVPLFAAVVFGISLAIVRLLKRIPIVRVVVP